MTSNNLFQDNVDFNSPNKNIFPITTNLSEDGEIFVGGCRLSDLANRFGTPLYVIDENTIRNSCKAYTEALNEFYPGKSLALYASKANSSIAISNIISSEGLGLDAVSEGELLTALNGGINPENIVFHGNNKSEQELFFAYKNKVTIVIDNQNDIDKLEKIIDIDKCPAKLMIRFTPGIECHTHEYIRTGHLDSKFGFDPDELENVFFRLSNCSWASLTGLHAHIGSQIFELEPHRDLVSVMLDTYELAAKFGHCINDLNFGGGLGVKYIHTDDPPSIADWIKTISTNLVNECKKRNIALPRLLCEPGRSLIASSGLTLYEIGSQKKITGLRNYFSVDGGMSDNPRPITYQSKYYASLVDRAYDKPTKTYTIAGKHCESGDILIKDFELPEVKTGEFLAIFTTGAYNISMSSNYNRIPRPAAIIVNNGQSDLIQRRETPEDLLRLDVIPDRFIELSSVN